MMHDQHMGTNSPAVLYVDDERSNRLVFDRTFSDDFRLITAVSGEEAVKRLATDNVGVLVTDQRMPGMSGNELMLHAKAHHPQVIRITITAYSDLGPILQAINDGLVARYIIKPWERDSLKAILEWALEAHSLGKRDSQVQLRLLETERLATIGSLGASIAHDMRQPLTYAWVHANRLLELGELGPVLQSILDSRESQLTSAQRDAVTALADDFPTAGRELHHAIGVIDELTIGMANLAHSPRTTATNGADPVFAVQQAIAMCQTGATIANAQLTYDGPETLPRVMLSQISLLQVFINLISNATEAIGRKPDSGTGKTVISLTENPQFVRFAVRDNGIGMSQPQLERATDPFYTTRTGGTGLGLSQCRRIIEEAGHRLTIESQEGSGTVVSFTLPLQTR